MKLIRHGHSCIELDVAGTRLLLDPGTMSDFEDVRGVDAVVVTHQHPDHLDPDRIDLVRTNNPDARWFADPATSEQLRAKGLEVTTTQQRESFEVGAATLTGVGSTHAEIHPYIERIDNVGILVGAPGEPTFFHPGDSLEGRPGHVDYLGVPLSAPWSAVKDTIAFVRAVGPEHVIPIHDGIVSAQGRGVYLNHVRDYGVDGGVDLLDPATGEVLELT